MKAKILITADDGKTYQADVEFHPITANGGSADAVPALKPQPAVATTGDVDFELGIRAFVKKYATGMSGPKRFTLLVSYLTKGDPTATVSLKSVERNWNKMKGLLGGPFNGAYSIRARDEGWLDTPMHGMYAVRPTWKEIR